MDSFFKEEYNKLNKYLNIIFNELEKEDLFLLNYSSYIDYLCRKIEVEFNDNIHYKLYDKKSALTFMDVYNLTRDIIKDINPKYLVNYDKILDNGILDFSYDNNDSSSFTYDYDTHKISININRKFNYRDIITLIHEFFHYTNYSENNTINQNVLTEFISIYFETYAIDYLRDIGIPIEQINPYDRLDDLSKNYKIFKSYSKILTMFNLFGSVDNDAIDMYKEKTGYIDTYKITEQAFELLFILQNIEQDYYESYDKKYNIEEVLSALFKDNYKYIIGTILAFYAIDNVDKRSIILLNDNINTKEVGNIDTIELLNMIGIDINDDSFIDKVVESIRKFVKNSEKQR